MDERNPVMNIHELFVAQSYIERMRNERMCTTQRAYEMKRQWQFNREIER